MIIDGEACALGEMPKPSLSFIFVTQLIPMKDKEESVEVGSRPNDRRRPHETG